MKILLILSCFVCAGLRAQTISDCKFRYDKYLNFRGSLGNAVKFDKESLSLFSGGKALFTVYNDELPAIADFFENSSLKDQAAFFKNKGTRRLSKNEKDSLLVVTNGKSVIKKEDALPLRGYRIALDPGHFGTNRKDAAVEQKFLDFVNKNNKDTVRLFESTLTFNTALIRRAPAFL